jgi:hypothetical protein
MKAFRFGHAITCLFVVSAQSIEEEQTDDHHQNQEQIGKGRGVTRIEVSQAGQINVKRIGLCG